MSAGRLIVASGLPSSDAQYHLRYPAGNAPTAGAALAAAAAVSGAISGVLSTGIKLAVAATVASAVAAALTTGSGGSWQLAAGHFVPHVQTIQMVAPRTGIGAHHAYTQWYPGIPYELPLSVLGGSWTFQYELTSGPTGMAVGQHLGDTNFGLIYWASPVAGTYSCSVTITDQEGNTTTASWTLVVGTANHIFIDPVGGHASSANGGTGTGSISSPFLTFNDMYAGTTGGTASGTRFDTTYRNYTVWYRAGTTTVNGFADSNGGVEMGDKPTIHIAYPGEAVTLDFNTHNCCWEMGSSDVCIIGFNFPNIPGNSVASGLLSNCIRTDSGGTDHLYYNNTLQTPTTTANSGANPAWLMIDQNGSALTQYVAIVGNTVEGNNGFDVFLFYNTQYTVVENNALSNIADLAFYFKIGNENASVRNNTMLTGNTGSLLSTDAYNNPFASNSIEVSFNKVITSGNGWLVGLTPNAPETNLWSIRNTWVVNSQQIQNVTASMTVIDDAVEYSNASANSHGWISSGGTFASFVASGEECVGHSISAVDSSGNLMGAYLTYIGTRGAQIA